MARRNRRPSGVSEDLWAVLGLATEPEPELINADRTRAHVRRLRENGWGIRTIAERSGLALITVKGLVSGRSSYQRPTRRVYPSTEAKILDIDPGEPKPVLGRWV